MRAYPRYVLVVLAILCSSVACDDSKNPVNNETDDYELLASETIGADGGTLGDDRFTLTIPAGAFTSSSSLSLYQDNTSEPFGANQASGTFFIEGIPDTYNQPVEVSIQYDGQLSGAGKIAVGENNILSISDEGSVVYSLFSAEDSSGYLTASIPAQFGMVSSSARSPKLTGGQADNNARKIMAIKNQVAPVTTSDGNFIVHYPAFLSTSIRGLIAEDLVKALQTIKAMNYKTTEIAWPINVHISPLKDRDENRCVAFMPAYDKLNLYVDSEKLKDPSTFYDNISCGLGRELFHAILSKYDYNYLSGALLELNLEHFWFHTAVALWGEEKFRTAAIAVPIAFWGDDYLMMGDRGGAPFRGLQKGIGTTRYDAYQHGCGMAGMFKYLADQYGESVILDIYNDISTTDCHPVTALLRNISDPVSTWWPAFMRSYMAGEIYKYDPLGDVGDYSEGLRTNSDRTFRIDDKDDKEQDLMALPPDISAADFAVMLDYKDLDSSASLRATMNDLSGGGQNLLMMVYGFGFRTTPFGYFLEPFDEVTNEITVSNLRALTDNDYRGIVFVATNANYQTPDYKGDRIINMQFEVLTPEFNYDYCDFIFYSDMTIKSVDASGTTTWTTDMAVGQSYVQGSFHGNTFIGTLDPDTHYEEGTIEITIDPKTYHVINFKYNTSTEDQGLINTWSVESNGDVDIPDTFISPFNDAQDNEVTGQYVCDHTTVEMLWQFSGTTQTVESISCNSTSYITISFENSSGE